MGRGGQRSTLRPAGATLGWGGWGGGPSSKGREVLLRQPGGGGGGTWVALKWRVRAQGPVWFGCRLPRALREPPPSHPPSRDWPGRGGRSPTVWVEIQKTGTLSCCCPLCHPVASAPRNGRCCSSGTPSCAAVPHCARQGPPRGHVHPRAQATSVLTPVLPRPHSAGVQRDRHVQRDEVLHRHPALLREGGGRGQRLPAENEGIARLGE